MTDQAQQPRIERSFDHGGETGAPIVFAPLHPGQLSVLRTRAALFALIPLVAVGVLDLVWREIEVLPPGAITAAAALVLGSLAMLLPGRRYRSWGYAMAEDELHIRHGLWTRVRTVVPFSRVQHIDVAQGPIERRFGVGTLILHTAGTRNSAVALPGLKFEEAGRMRDIIRDKIRQDPA